MNDTFASSPYPYLTHLCIPGDILNAPNAMYFRRDRNWRERKQTVPIPRRTPENSLFDWPTLHEPFPALTHLYLPHFLLPPTTIGIKAHTLVKVVLGPGLPIYADLVRVLLEQQWKSLKHLDVGLLMSLARMPDLSLTPLLSKCKLEVFKMDADQFGIYNDLAEFLPSFHAWGPTLKVSTWVSSGLRLAQGDRYSLRHVTCADFSTCSSMAQINQRPPSHISANGNWEMGHSRPIPMEHQMRPHKGTGRKYLSHPRSKHLDYRGQRAKSLHRT